MFVSKLMSFVLVLVCRVYVQPQSCYMTVYEQTQFESSCLTTISRHLPFFELLFVIEVLFLSICSLNEMMVDNLCIIHQIILCPAAAREACSMIRSAVPAATCVQNIVIYVAIRLKLKASINIEQKNRLVCWTEGFS